MITRTGEAAVRVFRGYGVWVMGGLILIFLVLLARKVVEREAVLRRNAEGYAVFLKMYEPRSPAPTFSLQDTSGVRVELQSFLGKVVFLTFRTTW